MRLTEVLHRSPRKKAKELSKQYKRSVANYRFMQVPVLLNNVKPESFKTKDMPCQQSYSTLMQCWKDSNFEEGHCLTEASLYQTCMRNFTEQREKAKKQAQVSELDGSWQQQRRLSTGQANLLLKMYPRQPYEFKITHDFKKPLKEPIVFKENGEKNLNASYHKKLWRRD